MQPQDTAREPSASQDREAPLSNSPLSGEELPASREREVVREIERHLGEETFDRWFRGRTSIAVANDQVTIGVDNPFLLAWTQRQFHAAVTVAARGVLGETANVRFQAPEGMRAVRRPPRANAPDVHSPRRAAPPAAKNDPRPHRSPAKATSQQPAPSPIPRETSAGAPAGAEGGRRFADLSEFVKGACNELALTAVLQVCEQPGVRYNPLVLYGGVGTGKTHLLEAIYRRLRARHRALNVLFLSAESFANFFTQALRDRTLPGFRNRFRTVDVLMVDDVDFLDGKRVIQEEFLHTIRQLESHQRQIVLTADRHPRLLTRLSDELVTRFIAGIVCRIESPDLATRRAIVAQRAKRLAASVDENALELVAQRFTASVREIEGALNTLETYALMSGEAINRAVAERVLSDLERDCVRTVRVADVERTVCRVFAVDPGALRSSRRSRSLSQPRMLTMFLARKLTQAAYREIGEHFGGRNHSTVVSAEKRVRRMIDAGTTLRVASQNWRLGDLMTSLEQQLLTG